MRQTANFHQAELLLPNAKLHTLYMQLCTRHLFFFANLPFQTHNPTQPNPWVNNPAHGHLCAVSLPLPFTFSIYSRSRCVQDITYELGSRGTVPLGTEFTVDVQAQNTSRFERTVNMTLTLYAVYHTGAAKRKIRSEIFNFNLCSLRSQYTQLPFFIIIIPFSQFLARGTVLFVFVNL